MLFKKIIVPCFSNADREAAFRTIVKAGGKIQDDTIDYKRNELRIYVSVEPGEEGLFKKFIDATLPGATVHLPTRGKLTSEEL